MNDNELSQILFHISIMVLHKTNCNFAELSPLALGQQVKLKTECAPKTSFVVAAKELPPGCFFLPNRQAHTSALAAEAQTNSKLSLE